MQLAKNGQIANICGANAILTLAEYAEDYGDDEFKQLAGKVIADKIKDIPNETVRDKARAYLEKIHNGERDFKF